MFKFAMLRLMRELKFRAWHPKLNYFVYFGKMIMIHQHHYTLIASSLNAVVYHYWDEPETIQQSIGLIDMFGKDIFEGDILRNQAGRIFVVEYIRKGFEYREILQIDGTPKLQDYSVNYIGDEALCQIVGNVLENPTLINSL